MPETKITRQKIQDHFRRLWAAYLAGIVIVLFLNNLVFTVTRPSFSDDETLKIMLLNVQAEFDETALLESIQDTGIRAVECEELAASGDSTGNMLLVTKLVSGFGDIYITDETGLAQMENRDACENLDDVHIPGLQAVAVTRPESGEAFTGALKTPDGRCLVIPSNSTNIEQAKQALPILAKMIME